MGGGSRAGRGLPSSRASRARRHYMALATPFAGSSESTDTGRTSDTSSDSTEGGSNAPAAVARGRPRPSQLAYLPRHAGASYASSTPRDRQVSIPTLLGGGVTPPPRVIEHSDLARGGGSDLPKSILILLGGGGAAGLICTPPPTERCAPSLSSPKPCTHLGTTGHRDDTPVTPPDLKR